MRERNIDFQEKYKSVDSFIKGAYGTPEGVSEYIRQMEISELEGSLYKESKEWNSDYKHLKRSRWIRNQLAHEVSIDSDICEEDDYSWLSDFHKRLFEGEDSLAVLNRAKQRYRSQSANKSGSKIDPEKDYHIRFKYDVPVPEEAKKGNWVWLIILPLIVIVGYLIVKIL